MMELTFNVIVTTNGEKFLNMEKTFMGETIEDCFRQYYQDMVKIHQESLEELDNKLL